MKKRIFYFCIFIMLVLVEVLIALFCHDNFIRPYIGDVIVVIVLYFFAKAVLIKDIKLLPLWIFIFACAIEIGQYFNYVELLGFADNPIISTIMGTSFAFEDIVCYAVGCGICILFNIIEHKQMAVQK